MIRFSSLVLAMTLLASHQTHAANRCDWTEGSRPVTITRIVPGVAYIPGSAEPGDVIGTPNVWEYTSPTPFASLLCWNDGSLLWNFNMKATSLFTGDLPPVAGEPSNGFIMNTNITGIGARIRFRQPFMGRGSFEFMPEGGPRQPLVPFNSTYQFDNAVGGLTISGYWTQVTLVKTGEIAPGRHTVDSELFTGHFDAFGQGLVLRYRLQAEVLQTQCSVIGDPISASPVDLKTWDKSVFVGRGTTTAIVPFSITLSNCKTDPGGLSRATIELDPVDGSLPVSAAQGVFSLTSDSTAEGIGIQVLKEDDSALALQSEVDIKALQDGMTVLRFGARFYQTEDSSLVRAGEAKGALNFTLRYR